MFLKTMNKNILDKLGMAASSLCAVHCALAPLLITIAPLVGLGFIFDEKFESIIIVVSIGLAFLSLVWGFYKNHRSFVPLYVLLLGCAFIYLARQESIALPEPLFMALGGLSIAISHFINMKLCNHCDDCHDHKH